MVVSGHAWSVSQWWLAACGVQWLGAITSDGRSVSGSQAPPTQAACHGTPASLTTIAIHSIRQV